MFKEPILGNDSTADRFSGKCNVTDIDISVLVNQQTHLRIVLLDKSIKRVRFVPGDLVVDV